MIITNDLIKTALSLIELTAREILLSEGTTWGPRWVEGFISAPGVSGAIPFKFGKVTEWNNEWGKRRFTSSEIALKKLNLAERFGDDTSSIIEACPWVLEEGEFLYAGGISRFGINVGVSGAKGRVDEAIANLLVDCIIMLAHLETDARIARHEMQI